MKSCVSFQSTGHAWGIRLVTQARLAPVILPLLGGNARGRPTLQAK